MKLHPKRGDASIEVDDWLATMRTAWKTGIDRDQREQSAASTRRLARVVAPEEERPRRQLLRDVLPLAACVAACLLGGIWLRHTMAAPRASAIHDIRADEARETPAAVVAPGEPDPVPAAATAASSAGSGAVPAASVPVQRPAPLAPSKAKSETETLPPLPRPTPSTSNGDDDDERGHAFSSSHSRKLKHFELKLDGRWLLRRPPPHAKPPRHTRPPGRVRDL